VDTLVNITEDQLLTTLTKNDYQELVAVLDKLIDVVGEDENHFLAPLMEFIGNLIEKYKGEVDMTASRPPGRGLRAAYNADEPEYTTAQLNLIKSQRQNPTVRQRTASRPPGRGLRAAYSVDEPEYTTAQLNLIKSQRQNPTVRQRTASRPPGRGLRAAYNADEPEYTTAQLNLIKSQYQNSTER
jgi:hypothetical protein